MIGGWRRISPRVPCQFSGRVLYRTETRCNSSKMLEYDKAVSSVEDATSDFAGESEDFQSVIPREHRSYSNRREKVFHLIC